MVTKRCPETCSTTWDKGIDNPTNGRDARAIIARKKAKKHPKTSFSTGFDHFRPSQTDRLDISDTWFDSSRKGASFKKKKSKIELAVFEGKNRYPTKTTITRPRVELQKKPITSLLDLRNFPVDWHLARPRSSSPSSCKIGLKKDDFHLDFPGLSKYRLSSYLLRKFFGQDQRWWASLVKFHA